MRMNPMLPAASFMNNMKLETGRGRGRPRRRWIEVVTDALRINNITAYQATENSLSREPINAMIVTPNSRNGQKERKKKILFNCTVVHIC
jgi:hypothetical protein